MAQTFSCPNCGAPLDYASDGVETSVSTPTLRCPYCANSVIVPQELRHQKSEPVPAQVSMSLMGQAANLRELARLTPLGQKEEAAQLYRQIFGADDPTARQAVDQMIANSTVVVASSAPVTYDITTSSYTIQTGMPGVTVQGPTIRLGRGWRWAIGCFTASIVFIIVVSTVVPLIIGLLAAFLPFFVQ
jgi:DNA-directed RNA polymerase subunit RPC12/RpoP